MGRSGQFTSHRGGIMGQPTSPGANSWAYMGLVGVHLEQLAPARNPGHLDLGAKMDRNSRILAILDSVAEVSTVFVFFVLCPQAPCESNIPCFSVWEAVLEARVCHTVSK